MHCCLPDNGFLFSLVSGCSPHTVHRAHVGESEKVLREAFTEASSHAKSGKPSVIFIDEIDALCPRRASRYVKQNNALLMKLILACCIFNYSSIDTLYICFSLIKFSF